MVLFIIFFFIREPFFVRLREHDYDPGENTVNNFPEDFQISDIIFHPNYKLDQGYDDVALLKLAKEATYKVKLFFSFISYPTKVYVDAILDWHFVKNSNNLKISKLVFFFH